MPNFTPKLRNLNILKKRRKKYFYLWTEKAKQEKIIVEQKLLDKIEKEFYQVKMAIFEIKGFSTYKGLVRGKVYNFEARPKIKKNKFQKNFILVASMTHPKDILLIRKAKAIVTDEGGILSHVAIISRELKIPCIIGTKIATKILKDGDLVEVDATKGIIKKIK